MSLSSAFKQAASIFSPKGGRSYNSQGDADQRAHDDAVEKDHLQRRQDQEDQSRSTALFQLDQAFKNPGRTASREAQYEAQLQAALAGGQAQHTTNLRKNALAAAGRGVLGGSVDLEGQAGAQANFQSGVQDATNTAANQLTAANNADQQEYQSLKNAISSGDSTVAAQWQSEARQNQNQADSAQAFYNFGQQGGALNAQIGAANSQMYGSLLSSGAQDYRTTRLSGASTSGGY